MNKLHDPELELFKRTVDLADYAKRAGYELRPQDGAPGLTVLDHPNRDRIVVGQHPNGPWVYASVPDYTLRAPGEPAEQALARLRERDQSLAGQGDHRRVRAAARSDGAPRGRAARPGARSLAELSSHGSAPRLRGCPLSTAVPARSRAGDRTGPRSAALGRIGRTQVRAQSASLRLEPARRERAAGDRSGAPAPGVA